MALFGKIFLFLLCLRTSLSQRPDPDYQPLIELGHVDLSEYAECEEKMSDHLTTCQEKYHEKVRNKINEMNGNMRTESVKRSICCGAWSAKKCVADASERIDQCPVNITEQYRALPSDIKVKDHVFDKCSEYQEGSAICYEDGHHSHWFNLHSLATILVSIFVVSVVIVALVAIYQRNAKFRDFVDRLFNRDSLHKSAHSIESDVEMQEAMQHLNNNNNNQTEDDK